MDFPQGGVKVSRQYTVVNVPNNSLALRPWEYLEFVAVDPKDIGDAPVFDPFTGESIPDPNSGLLVSVEVAAFHLSLADHEAGEWAQRCGQGGYFCLPRDLCRHIGEISPRDYSLMLVGKGGGPR